MKKTLDFVYEDGAVKSSEVILLESTPEHPDLVRIQLHLDSKSYSSDGDTFFEALSTLRTDLEQVGIRPCCLGASENVYPSPMLLSMGVGDQAYRLTFGVAAKTADLVNIFDKLVNAEPVDCKTQAEFYKKWLSSLGA
jgi:hypothetical protein